MPLSLASMGSAAGQRRSLSCPAGEEEEQRNSTGRVLKLLRCHCWGSSSRRFIYRFCCCNICFQEATWALLIKLQKKSLSMYKQSTKSINCFLSACLKNRSWTTPFYKNFLPLIMWRDKDLKSNLLLEYSPTTSSTSIFCCRGVHREGDVQEQKADEGSQKWWEGRRRGDLYPPLRSRTE